MREKALYAYNCPKTTQMVRLRKEGEKYVLSYAMYKGEAFTRRFNDYEEALASAMSLTKKIEEEEHE